MERGEASQHQHCLLLGGENHQAFTKEGKIPKSIQQLQSRGCLRSEAHAGEATGVGWWLDQLLLASTGYLARNAPTEE